jgi:hypothetical protein
MPSGLKHIAISPVRPVCKKDCPDRAIGCHGQCEKYKKFRAECDRAIDERHQIAEFRNQVDTYVYKAVKRLPGKRRF